MRYSVHSRQPISVLRRADQIRVAYEDRDMMLDLIEQLPDKTYIVEISNNPKEINWNLFEMYNDKVDLLFSLSDLSFVPQCKEHGIRFFWAYPITSYFELDGLVALEPAYLFLGAPLCFDLPNIAAITEIPVRLCANLAYDAYVPRINGICGQWIRPEDVPAYEPYVEVIDFWIKDTQREQILLSVYKEKKTWPGNLNLLIDNLNVNVDNRAFAADFGEHRVKCGQRCLSHSTCHYCQSAFDLATALSKKADEMRS